MNRKFFKTLQVKASQDWVELCQTLLRMFKVFAMKTRTTVNKEVASLTATALVFNIVAATIIFNSTDAEARKIDTANLEAKNATINVEDVFTAAKTKTTDFTSEELMIDIVDYEYEFANSETKEINMGDYAEGPGSFTNDRSSSVQWPFPKGVPITSHYGKREAPCKFCSSNHKGLDFAPPEGAGIQAIADGIVLETRNFPISYMDTAEASFGSYVKILHNIEGEPVESLYAHLLFNSIQLVAGQEVKVGDFIGQVGATGISTGPHLHLEIKINDERINPYPWLEEMNEKTSRNVE